MPDHRIRLRGPWEVVHLEPNPEGVSRITLPTNSLPSTDQPLRILRRFGRPPRLSESDLTPCRIEIEDAPGLIQITFNDESLPLPESNTGSTPGTFHFSVNQKLQARNMLVLTISAAPSRPVWSHPWGSISLVFEGG